MLETLLQISDGKIDIDEFLTYWEAEVGRTSWDAVDKLRMASFYLRYPAANSTQKQASSLHRHLKQD